MSKPRKKKPSVSKPSVDKSSVTKPGTNKPSLATPSQPPVRTITDAQRKSTFRTFLWILGGFIATIGLLVATFSFQGRAARDYGSRAVQAAIASKPSPSISYEQPCADLLNSPLPSTVTSCTIKVVSGKPEAVLNIEGGRQYRLTK